jgi:hypothetical protein
MSLVEDESVEPLLVYEVPGRKVWTMDSVAFGSADLFHDVIITGSHGGTSAGEYAARFNVAVVVSNDAGGGKRDAGTAGLRDVDAHGIIGIATSHESSRIGDGQDAWENGVVSFVNATAARFGIRVGEPLQPQIIELVEKGGF